MAERVRLMLAITKVLIAALVVACAAGVAVSSPMVTTVSSATLAIAAAVVVRNAWQHERVARAMAVGSRPGAIEGVAVRWRPLSSHAGVAGLRRPTIFCDPGLAWRLTADELRAVVLHERAHQRRRDPLRLVALASLEPLFGRFPGGRAWLECRRANIEIRADRDALQQGVPRPALTRALLKLGDSDVEHATAAFSSAVELRLRALVDPDPARSLLRRWCGASLAVVVVFVVCVGAATDHWLWLTPAGGLACVLAGC